MFRKKLTYTSEEQKRVSLIDESGAEARMLGSPMEIVREELEQILTESVKDERSGGEEASKGPMIRTFEAEEMQHEAAAGSKMLVVPPIVRPSATLGVKRGNNVF